MKPHPPLKETPRKSLSVVTCVSSNSTLRVAHHTPPHAQHVVSEPSAPAAAFDAIGAKRLCAWPFLASAAANASCSCDTCSKREQVGSHTDTHTATQHPHSLAKARHVTTWLIPGDSSTSRLHSK